MGIEILSAGFYDHLRSAEPYGYRRFGVPASGPMDEFAYLSANALVGNPPMPPLIEIGPGEFYCVVRRPCWLVAALVGEH